MNRVSSLPKTSAASKRSGLGFTPAGRHVAGRGFLFAKGLRVLVHAAHSSAGH